MKGVSEIATAALYIGVSITAITAAITIGQPAIENMQDAAAIRKAQNFMQDLDTSVQQVVAEGEGSTRTLTVNLDRGELYFDNESNTIVYEIETDAELISPQSSQRTGNVVLSSSADVSVYNVTSGGDDAPSGYSGPDCYMMENEHLKACIKQVGAIGNEQSLNTSNLLTYYEFKDQTKTFDGSMKIELNEIYNTSWGTGYTRPVETGSYIGTGQVRAHVSSEYGYKYDIVYSLPTGSDFMKVDVKNFQ
jgi:hypothetical protein